MSYPAFTKTLNQLIESANIQAQLVFNNVTSVRSRAVAGTVQRAVVIKQIQDLNRAIAAWDEASARGAELATYAQAQMGSNVAAEFPAMRAATVDLRDFLLTLNDSVDSYANLLNVSPADLATYITKADALLATIG